MVLLLLRVYRRLLSRSLARAHLLTRCVYI